MQDIDIDLKRVTLPPAKKKRVDLPNAEDVVKAIVGTDIELPCLLAMWLSLRISEVLGLQFGDISKDGRYITVNRVILTINGHGVLSDRTKTEDSARTNSLPVYLRDMISKIPHKKDSDFIVTMSYKQISARFNKIMSANGYSITFHKLRHEFATTLNDLGVPSDYIQKIGGWSTDNIMKSVYTHTTKNKETEYQNMIDGFFNKAISSVT
ncbi:MAG: site-specific integrase [Ruminococcus sp.]|nr:site-specific integrase [Ruminococcus sp.]